MATASQRDAFATAAVARPRVEAKAPDERAIGSSIDRVELERDVRPHVARDPEADSHRPHHPGGGFTGSVSLSVDGLPSGATGSFSPNPATSSSTLSVTASASTPTGSKTLTMTGASGSLAHSTTVTLLVKRK